MINVDESVKGIIYVKKIMFGIFLLVALQMEFNQQVLEIKLFVLRLQTQKKRILIEKM